MKSISELKTEFSTVKSRRCPRNEKLSLVKSIRSQIGLIEREAGWNFAFPLSEIVKVKRLISEVDYYLQP